MKVLIPEMKTTIRILYKTDREIKIYLNDRTPVNIRGFFYAQHESGIFPFSIYSENYTYMHGMPNVDSAS